MAGPKKTTGLPALSRLLRERATVRLAAERSYDPLEVESRRGLATHRREITRRLNENPRITVLLLVNPVLAFAEVNVKLTREVADHVLHTLRHPRRVRERLDALEGELREGLGEAPRPTDPAWLATALFDRLGLEPLDTADHTPAYRSAIAPEAMERLQQLRPTLVKRARMLPRPLKGTRLTVAPERHARRRLDLDAATPALAPVSKAPAGVSLEELWFYKDRHPLARKLLELGLIHAGGVRIHTPDGFRKIRDGQRVSPFRALVTGVRLKTRGR